MVQEATDPVRGKGGLSDQETRHGGRGGSQSEKEARHTGVVRGGGSPTWMCPHTWMSTHLDIHTHLVPMGELKCVVAEGLGRVAQHVIVALDKAWCEA